MILEELSQKQQKGLPAYFKGGTALYKALKTTRRFSEDIDLSVDTRDCSRTQNDKRLEMATKKYQTLTRVSNTGKTNRSEVVAVYNYDPVVTYDSDDSLQRFGKLKVEATSFTISEPVIDLEISPIIYELSNDKQKEILRQQYDVKPFKVKTITLERIFIDKLFAAESYVRKSKEKQRAFEAAKHIYDLSVMMKHVNIINLMKSEVKMKFLLDIRITEEQGRLDGIPGISPSSFIFFKTTKNNKEVKKAYEIMQNQYVFRQEDRISFQDVVDDLLDISIQLNQNPSWYSYYVKESLEKDSEILIKVS